MGRELWMEGKLSSFPQTDSSEQLPAGDGPQLYPQEGASGEKQTHCPTRSQGRHVVCKGVPWDRGVHDLPRTAMCHPDLGVCLNQDFYVLSL